MTKWFAAVAAPVVAALATAFLTDWFGLSDSSTPGGQSTAVATPGGAVARVTAFNQFGNRIGQSPTAKITVENQGTKTAANCVVGWKSGIKHPVGIAQMLFSEEFPLRPNQSTTVELSDPLSWSKREVTSASAWIDCSNTKSPERSKLVFVS